MLQKYKISSESVCQGHPDKLCDAVSDTVLDAYLAQDPEARVACETMATNGLLVIAGEVSSEASVDIEALARRAAAEAGYTDSRFGFSAESCAVLHAVVKQSEDIDAGVSRSLEEKQTEGNCGLCFSCQESDPSMKNGAGDQGMMYGYACRETASLMPAPIVFAHRLCRRLDTVRREGLLPYLGPDGKAMVTVSYEGGEAGAYRYGSRLGAAFARCRAGDNTEGYRSASSQGLYAAGADAGGYQNFGQSYGAFCERRA